MNNLPTSSLVAQRIQAFDQRHGGRANSVQSESGWILYLDGSRREAEPHGALCDAPTDEYDLAVAVLDYWKARHAQVVGAFNQLKSELMHTTPEGQKGGLERLKQLKKSAEALQEDMDDAAASLSRTSRAKAMQGHKQSQAEQRSRIAAFHSQVKSVRLGGGSEDDDE